MAERPPTTESPTTSSPTTNPGARPVAVVTGASQGLGLALAEALAAEGWALVIDARRADRLDAAVARLAEAHRGRRRRRRRHRSRAPGGRSRRAAARLGDVHLVVNNASTLGASPLPALTDIDPDVLRRVFDVNVIAPIALVQALDPHLGDGATVVNITSDAGGRGVRGMGWLRRVEGRARAREPGARRGAARPAGARRRPRRHAHRDAPGRVPRRGHLRSARARRRAFPALLALIDGDEPSGRYERASVGEPENRGRP